LCPREIVTLRRRLLLISPPFFWWEEESASDTTLPGPAIFSRTAWSPETSLTDGGFSNTRIKWADEADFSLKALSSFIVVNDQKRNRRSTEEKTILPKRQIPSLRRSEEVISS
jgi:hypothetical protein